jgi:hypothetical protein
VEIMATLDATQSIDGLPFMPEMLQYCGKRFQVYKSAHKTCDTIEKYVIRRMADTVHLEGLRCDGDAHGGCQAGCLLFWKDAWLKRVQPGEAASASGDCSSPSDVDRSTAPPACRWRQERTRSVIAVRHRSDQATTEVRRRDRWDPRFYLKDLIGQRDPSRFRVVRRDRVVNSFTIRWRGRRYPHLWAWQEQNPEGLAESPARRTGPGAIEGRDHADAELGPSHRLYFDVEMVPFCEAGLQGLGRIDKIIDEKTGRLITPNPCLILDGVPAAAISARAGCSVPEA